MKALLIISFIFLQSCASEPLNTVTSNASNNVTNNKSKTSLTSRAATKPLAERINLAKAVFVGKVVNKVIDGDWARAELLVEEPLAGVTQGQKLEVTWRKTIGGRTIYDTPEGSRGIAILIDKRQNRYWLRSDKFESVELLNQVKELIEQN